MDFGVFVGNGGYQVGIEYGEFGRFEFDDDGIVGCGDYFVVEGLRVNGEV